MADGAANIVKYLLFFFNFIFFICGLGIIIGGALVFTIYNDYVDFTGNSGNAVPIVLIIVGAVIFVVGFLGCCGAIRENYTMMALFAFFMVLLLIVEVGVGISGYVLKDEIGDAIEKNMSTLMEHNYMTSNATKKLFDDMHKDLKCCGTHNYTDWFGGFYSGVVCAGAEPGCVPESCCKKGADPCVNNPVNTETIYTEGCSDSLHTLLTDNIAIIAAVAIVIAVVEVFGIVCSCCLMKSIKSGYEVV